MVFRLLCLKLLRIHFQSEWKQSHGQRPVGPHAAVLMIWACLLGSPGHNVRVPIIKSIFVVASLAFTVSCGNANMSEAPKAKKEHVDFAVQFATALAEHRFEDAHGMLSEDLNDELSKDILEELFKEMISYGPGAVKVDGHTNSMGDWPGKDEKELAWVYVSLSGDGFGEAITVVVVEENGKHVVGEVEWGRP